MRLNIALVILLTVGMVPPLTAEPAIEWDIHRRENSADAVTTMLIHPQNQYMIVGINESFGPPMFVLWQVSRAGQSLGASQFMIANFPDPNWPNIYPAACLTQDAGYVIFGTITYDDRSAWRGCKVIEFVENDRWRQRIAWGGNYFNDQPAYSSATAVTASQDGGYVIAGILARQDQRPVSHLLKLDGDGEVIWSESIEAMQDDSINMVGDILETDGGFVLCGTRRVGDASLDAWLAKVDEEGAPVWLQTFDIDDLDQEAKKVIELREGGWAIVGSSMGDDGEDCLLLVTNEEGEEAWHSTFSFGELHSEFGETVVQLPDDWGFVIGGTTYLSNRTNYGFLVGADMEGNLAWHGDIERNFDRIRAVTFDETDRSTLICGSSSENSQTSRLTKLNFAPRILQQEPLGDVVAILEGEGIQFRVEADDIEDDELTYQWEVDDEIWANGQTFDFFGFDFGEFQITNRVSDTQLNDTAEWLVRVTHMFPTRIPDRDTLVLNQGDSAVFSVSLGIPRESLDILYWTLDRDSISDDTTVTILFSDTGWHHVECRGSRGDILELGRWVVQVSSPGGIEDNRDTAPVVFGLVSILPNPFNATTRIEFSLDRAQNASLKALDMQGRVVAKLAEERFARGSHSVAWNAGDLPAGIYVVKLETTLSVRTQKVVLLK